MRKLAALSITITAILSVFCQSQEDTRIAGLEESILSRINDTRLENGSGELNNNETLADVARAHCEDMAERNYFSHTTPEGVTFDKRIQNAKITYLQAGENIYMRVNPQISGMPVESLAAAVVDAWLASAGHKEVMLDTAYNEAGIGCYFLKSKNDDGNTLCDANTSQGADSAPQGYVDGNTLYVTLDVIKTP